MGILKDNFIVAVMKPEPQKVQPKSEPEPDPDHLHGCYPEADAEYGFDD